MSNFDFKRWLANGVEGGGKIQLENELSFNISSFHFSPPPAWLRILNCQLESEHTKGTLTVDFLLSSFFFFLMEPQTEGTEAIQGHYTCGWNDCKVVLTNWKTFRNHVQGHSKKNSAKIQCLWRDW